MRLSLYASGALGLLASPASAVSHVSAGPTNSSCSAKPPAFFLAGDSTTAPAGGWGDAFLSLLKKPAWGTNYARSGRTTVSFVKGGDWAKVIAAVKNSTASYECYVTIQVGVTAPLSLSLSCNLLRSFCHSIIQGQPVDRETCYYFFCVSPANHHPTMMFIVWP